MSVATGLAGQGALVISGVLVARLLGVENRGYLALLAIVPVIISQAGGLGLPAATTYYIAREPGHAGAIARSLLRPAALQIVFLTAAQAAVLHFLLRGDGSDVTLAGALSLPAAGAMLTQQYGLAILQGERRYRAFNVARLAPAVTYATTLVALSILGADDLPLVAALWAGGLVIMALVTATLAATGLPAAAREADSPPRRGTIMRFGLRAFLGSSYPAEIFQPDQAVVGLFLAPASLGVYATATAFNNLPRFVSQSIGMVAYPSVASSPDRGAASDQIRRFLAVTAATSGAMVIGIEASVQWLVPFLFGSEFSEAVPIVRILLVGAFFVSLRRVLTESLRGLGRAGMGSVAEFASWASLLPALAVLMPAAGATGAAAAMALSSFIACCFLFAVTLRQRK